MEKVISQLYLTFLPSSIAEELKLLLQTRITMNIYEAIFFKISHQRRLESENPKNASFSTSKYN